MHSESSRRALLRSWATFASILVLAVGAIVLTSAYQLQRHTARNTVRLPIEVLGQDGHTESVTVDISSGAVDSLYLRVHNITYHWSEYAENGTDPYFTQSDQERYDEKASFRINDGPWVGITEDRVTCRFPEKAFDCLSGPLATKALRLKVAATGSGAWVNGSNTIDFRFNGTDGYTSGYRVIGLDVMSGSQSLLRDTDFVWDDPSQWTAPYANPSAVSEGADLWSQRNLLVESSLPDAPSIVASCADCHARDGRDLKYFNFSNKSIISRSRFHGLTDDQGRKIASYIRSVDLGLPNGYTVNEAGRPWNPPYQPGPGLDERPVELWAAGAGVDCIAQRDIDSAPFMFPDASSRALLESPQHDPNLGVDCQSLRGRISMTSDRSALNGFVHPDSTLNNREVPTVQWPDIFEWWPDIHPVDIWDVATVSSQEWYQNYLSIHNDLESRRNEMIQKARAEAGEARGNIDDRLDTALGKRLDRFNRWDPPTSANFSTEFEKRYSARQFLAIKTWEVMHEHDLEGLGADIYGPEGQNDAETWGPNEGSIPNNRFISGQDRVWFNNANIYDTSPHKNQRTCCGASGVPEYGSDDGGTHRNARSRSYWGDAWYDVALTLSPGNRMGRGNDPFDWNYNSMHIQNTSSWSNNQGIRYFRHYITGIQQHNRFYKPDSGTRAEKKSSWPRSMHGHSLQKLEVWEVQNMLGAMDATVRNELTEAAILSWVRMSNRYNVDDWALAGGNNNDIPPPTYAPELKNTIEWSSNRADMFYSMLNRWSSRQLSQQVLDAAARWGESMWPNGNWEQWMLAQGDQPIDLRPGWNIISSSVIPDDASLDSVFDPLGSSLVIVKNDAGESYVPAYGINEIGSWNVEEAYKVFVTSNQTFTIQGSSVDPTSSISLDAGWNLVPYYAASAMPAEDAFASLGSDLVVVRDYVGHAYLPDFGVNTLHGGSGEVRPGQGYQVFVSTDTELTYPDAAQNQSLRVASKSTSSGASGVASSLTLVLDAPSLRDGAQLVAQTSDSRTVGSGTVNGDRALVRVWGDDPQTDAVDGADDGDALTLRLASTPGASSPGETPLEVADLRDVLRDASVDELSFSKDAILYASLVAGPSEMNLKRNYPNPVRSTTTIEYAVSEQSPVRLQVFDVLGRRVATLMDETKAPGTYSVSFDASNLSSGPYFYRLEAAGSVVSRKMVVVR